LDVVSTAGIQRSNDGLQLDGVSDADLADGAGQVILDYIASGSREVEQMEILDVKDLRSVLLAAHLLVEHDQPTECEEVLVRAIRLLAAGYYRNLLLEEKEKVGRVSFRYEAMTKFRERIQRSDVDRNDLRSWLSSNGSQS